MKLVTIAGAKGSIILLAIVLVTATGCPMMLGPGMSMIVSFHATPTTGTAPLVVQFNGIAVTGPGLTAETWTWSFGDGSTGTGQNPSHTYTAPGTYTVSLTVDAVVAKFRGDIEPEPTTVRRTRINYIVVTTGNLPPVADAGPDQLSSVSAAVTLDGSGSSDPDADPITYAWAFTSNVPAGTTAVLANANTVSPSFTIDLPGSYEIQLIVNDGALDSAPDTVVITTRNRPPIADAGPDQALDVGAVATLDGSGSYDPDGDPITYAWAFTSNVPAGTTAVLANANTVSPSFTIDLPGSYEIQLIVNDGALDSAPDTVVITTLNRPPIADAGPDQLRDVGEMATLDGTASYDPDTDPITYAWAFTANIPAGTSAVLAGATTAHPTFMPDMPGPFEVQLIVNDGALDSAPDTMLVNTYDQPPVAVPLTLPETQVSVDPAADPIVSPDSSVLYGIPRHAEYNFGDSVEKFIPYELLLRQIDTGDASTVTDSEVPVVAVTAVPPITAIYPGGAKGLTINPITGIMWVILDLFGGEKQLPDHMLATLDPVTGVATPVGYPDVPFSEDFAGIAFDGVGNLFAVTGNSLTFISKQVDSPYSLYQLSKVDGSATFVFQFPESPSGWTRGEAIAFNSATGLMVHASGEAMGPTTRLLQELNLGTLAIGDIPLTPVTVGPDWDQPTAMTYDSVNDILYLADMTDSEVPTLYTIDQNAKAAENWIGEFTNFTIIKGLAFRHDREAPGVVVELDGADSYDPDGNSIVTYQWSFVQVPPGSAATITNPTSVSASFIPDVLGDYIIGLVVNDGTEDSPLAQVTVSYVNAPPVADAGVDQTLSAFQTSVQLNGSASFDPEYGPLTYSWTFQTVPAWLALTDANLSDPASPIPNFTIALPKDAKQAGPDDIVLELTVTDEAGATGTDTTVIDASMLLSAAR
ncbi:MAG: PKD domain-containing protein [Nitrospiraceae bacterium]|nr:PKD domain-containing protein [Nitrospiraceae bacterium]